jgi:hypothetical protein
MKFLSKDIRPLTSPGMLVDLAQPRKEQHTSFALLRCIPGMGEGFPGIGETLSFSVSLWESDKGRVLNFSQREFPARAFSEKV